MEAKSLKTVINASCQLALNGYMHIINYTADITQPKNAKIIEFQDHVVRIINKDILDTSGIETTFGHDGQNFNSTGWRNLPDDNGDKASDDMKSIYYAIEKGEFQLK